MATFTDIKGNLGVKLIITETSQDIPNNKTTISYSARVYKTESHNPYNNYTQTPFKLVINGEVIYNQKANYDLRDWTSSSRLSRTEQVITSGTRTITHSANGSKSISVSWSGNFTSTGTEYGYGAVLASDTMKLTDIPRVSKPSLSKVNFNFGESVVLTTNRMSTSFTHSASYIAEDVEVLLATDIGVSESIAIPVSRASSIPNSSSEKMKIRVKTFNGTAEIGSRDISVTVNVPSTATPKVDGVTLSETVSKANIFSSNNSNYIRGISKVKATASNARGEYGSTIVKYEFRLKEDTSYNGATTSSSFTFGEIRFPTSGSKLYSFQCRVQDSRGRYSTWADSTQVRFHHYAPPTISTPSLSRNDTVMSVNRTYSVQSIMEDGIERNLGSLSFQSRPKGNASWVTNGGAKHTGLNLSNNSASLSGVFLNNIAYEVQGIISDKLNTIYSGISTSGADFATLEVLLGTGIGAGKSPAAGGANIQVGTGGISSDGNIYTGGIVDSSSDIRVNGSSVQPYKLTTPNGTPLATMANLNNQVPGLYSVNPTTTNNPVGYGTALGLGGFEILIGSDNSARFRRWSGSPPVAGKWLNAMDKDGTSIPYSSNLNNYLGTGYYYIDTNAGAETLTNAPTEILAGFLEVFKSVSMIYQKWTNYGASSHANKVFIRGRNENSTWSEWTRLATTSDIPSLSDAYAPTSGGSGNNRWIKFPSGHQICWGLTTTTGSTASVTLPRAFTSTPMITVTGHHASHSPSTTVRAANDSSATFYIVDGRNGGVWGGQYTSGMTATIRYIATGIG